MRVLAFADEPPPLEPAELVAANPVDAVFTLGDLQPDWIASLATLDLRGLPGSERRKSCGSGASSRWISGSSAPLLAGRSTALTAR